MKLNFCSHQIRQRRLRRLGVDPTRAGALQEPAAKGPTVSSSTESSNSGSGTEKVSGSSEARQSSLELVEHRQKQQKIDTELSNEVLTTSSVDQHRVNNNYRGNLIEATGELWAWFAFSPVQWPPWQINKVFPSGKVAVSPGFIYLYWGVWKIGSNFLSWINSQKFYKIFAQNYFEQFFVKWSVPQKLQCIVIMCKYFYSASFDDTYNNSHFKRNAMRKYLFAN